MHCSLSPQLRRERDSNYRFRLAKSLREVGQEAYSSKGTAKSIETGLIYIRHSLGVRCG